MLVALRRHLSFKNTKGSALGCFSSRWTTTADGYESELQVNALSPALLSKLLLPNLRLAANSPDPDLPSLHLAVVSSDLISMAKFPESCAPEGQVIASLNVQSKYQQADRYPASKAIALCWAKQIACEVPSSAFIINAPNPGFCSTGLFQSYDGIMSYVARLFQRLLGRSPVDGARCVIDAVINKGMESHGRYLSELKVKEDPQVIAKNGNELQQKLWKEINAIFEEHRLVERTAEMEKAAMPIRHSGGTS